MFFQIADKLISAISSFVSLSVHLAIKKPQENKNTGTAPSATRPSSSYRNDSINYKNIFTIELLENTKTRLLLIFPGHYINCRPCYIVLRSGWKMGQYSMLLLNGSVTA
jgi:predicted class III extradiol MEMO1 family dioxygenase